MLGILEIRQKDVNTQHILNSPRTREFLSSEFNFVWCVVVVNSYQQMKKWNRISKNWCGREDFNFPGFYLQRKAPSSITVIGYLKIKQQYLIAI